MSKRAKQKRSRQNNFKVVVRGVRRDQPDHQRLMRATLDHYQSLKQSPDAATSRTRSPLGKEPS